MTYPYTATIEGKLRKITGMDADDYILDNDEKLWIKPLKEGETFRALTLEKVSKLTFTGGQWVLDGENVKSRYVGATIKSHESSGEARTEAETTFHLLEVLEEVSDEDRTKIKGVAWFRERYAEVDGETAKMCAVTNGDLDALAGIGSHKKRRPLPPAEGFRPVLLTDYQVSSQRSGDGQHAKSYEAAPDYFTNTESAAEYAGVTKRTVLNWKKRGWLKVEQNGKKIRIAKTDVDKCKSRQ